MKTEAAALFSLSGKVALLTGATGYLGRSMAFALASAGAHVYVNSRSLERCRSLVKEIVKDGGSADCAVFDVSDKEAVGNFCASVSKKPIDIIINNAYSGGGGSIEVSGTEPYLDSYHCTVSAAHHLVSVMLPNLRAAVEKSGYASVINIASMYGLVSPDQRIYDSAEGANPPFYGAAKAALIQWTRYAACEFGKESIRFNSISPGPFPSKIVQSAAPEFIEKLEQKVPQGRIGQTNEIRGPVVFLASPASSYVNGANLVVDGGWTCW